jgi:hypothetical protein
MLPAGSSGIGPVKMQLPAWQKLFSAEAWIAGKKNHAK